MATTMNQTKCFNCNEKEAVYECKGCSRTFCFDHLGHHQKTLDEDLNRIERHLTSFQEKLLQQKTDPMKRPFISEIDRWEKESIEKITQIAKQCRERLIKHTNSVLHDLEEHSNQLTKEIKKNQTKKKFNELHLNQLREKLEKLQNELDRPRNVSIEQQSTSFINRIIVTTSFSKDQKWEENARTVAGGNGHANQLNQLLNPEGIFIDDEQTMYIADCGNDRIVEWKSNARQGQVVAGGNGRGKEMNQLNSPADVVIDHEGNTFIIVDSGNRRILRWSRQDPTQREIIMQDIECCHLTMDKNGSLYVSDSERNEVKRWKKGGKNGTIVAGGNGKGDRLHQLNSPSYIFVDEDESLYVSDCENHRVMKWLKDAKEGIVVAGGTGQGTRLTQLSHPQGLIVDQWKQIYVADSGNDRVVRWCEGAKEGTIVVGGNAKGQQSNQLYYPSGLSFDRDRDLYVVDGWNDRVQKFEVA